MKLGRPGAHSKRDVFSSLLDAAQRSIREKSYDELTSSELARLAGTNQAMINYYFNNKGGLFSVLVENVLKGVASDLERLMILVAEDAVPQPTEAILNVLVKHYMSSSHLIKTLIDKMSNDKSDLNIYYRERSRRSFSKICQLIQQCKESGIYRQDLDTTHAAFMIICFTVTPCALGPVMDDYGLSIDKMSKDSWIRYIATVLDKDFRAAC